MSLILFHHTHTTVGNGNGMKEATLSILSFFLPSFMDGSKIRKDHPSINTSGNEQGIIVADSLSSLSYYTCTLSHRKWALDFCRIFLEEGEVLRWKSFLVVYCVIEE